MTVNWVKYKYTADKPSGRYKGGEKPDIHGRKKRKKNPPKEAVPAKMMVMDALTGKKRVK